MVAICTRVSTNNSTNNEMKRVATSPPKDEGPREEGPKGVDPPALLVQVEGPLLAALGLPGTSVEAHLRGFRLLVVRDEEERWAAMRGITKRFEEWENTGQAPAGWMSWDADQGLARVFLRPDLSAQDAPLTLAHELVHALVRAGALPPPADNTLEELLCEAAAVAAVQGAGGAPPEQPISRLLTSYACDAGCVEYDKEIRRLQALPPGGQMQMGWDRLRSYCRGAGVPTEFIQ